VIYAEGVPAETLLFVEENAVDFADYFRQYGWGGRLELMSRFRSAISPWIDLRNRAEVLRNRSEEGGFIIGLRCFATGRRKAVSFPLRNSRLPTSRRTARSGNKEPRKRRAGPTDAFGLRGEVGGRRAPKHGDEISCSGSLDNAGWP
jgi:hypothetical protein